MKNRMKYFISIVMILLLSLSLAACGSSSGSEGEVIDNEPDITEEPEEESEPAVVFDEESEDADVKIVDAKEEDYYGTWTATSDNAEYLYGDFTITIKKDGKWTGTITGEDMSGTWEKDGDHLNVTNDWIDVELAFAETGNLLLRRNVADEDDPEEDMLNTVLVKKE